MAGALLAEATATGCPAVVWRHAAARIRSGVNRSKHPVLWRFLLLEVQRCDLFVMLLLLVMLLDGRVSVLFYVFRLLVLCPWRWALFSCQFRASRFHRGAAGHTFFCDIFYAPQHQLVTKEWRPAGVASL